MSHTACATVKDWQRKHIAIPQASSPVYNGNQRCVPEACSCTPSSSIRNHLTSSKFTKTLGLIQGAAIQLTSMLWHSLLTCVRNTSQLRMYNEQQRYRHSCRIKNIGIPTYDHNVETTNSTVYIFFGTLMVSLFLLPAVPT